MFDYSDCYLTLGVTPDTDWKTLRASYRRLISQWHPDRYSADSAQRGIAEERSKQITLAYQALEKYRRDHGVLPPTTPAPTIAQESARTADPMQERAGFWTRGDTRGTGPATREHATRGPPRQSRVAIALGFSVLIAALYLVYHYWDEGSHREDQLRVKASDPSVAKPPPTLSEIARDSRGFSAGSTLGEVYAIQGVPTQTEGDTWYYGKSRIHFAQGKVVSWKEHPEDPLRLTRDPSARPHGNYFDVGSTKEDVRAIQGTPVRETDTMWDYAPSQVYFSGNRVIRWEESPVQPLRVPH